MANYMQFDPRIPRPQAPRGLAPTNMVKQAMAAGPYGNIPRPGMGQAQTVLGVDHSPLYRHLGIPVPGLEQISGPAHSTEFYRHFGIPVPQATQMNLAMSPSSPHPSLGGLGLPVPHPVAPSDTGIPQPPAPMIHPPAYAPGPPSFPVPISTGNYGATSQFGSAPPIPGPLPPRIPFVGSPLARQGSHFYPSTPAGQMTPFETRAQVPSQYGNTVATHGDFAGQGTANGYVSSPAARAPMSSFVSPAEMAMLNRDSNAGPFGSLGGSSSRTAAMKKLVEQQYAVSQQQQGLGAPAAVAHPWNPALMAQIQGDSRVRNDPGVIAGVMGGRDVGLSHQMVADIRNDQMRQTPQYIADRARQDAYNQQRDQRLAQNRGDAALAQGIATARTYGRPLSPAQSDLLYRTRQAQSGNYLPGSGGFGGGRGSGGTGLNAPPRPFAALNPAPTVTEMTPEREQQLLGLLEGVNEKTPPHELQRIRGMIQPGELEHLTGKHMPYLPISTPWTANWGTFNKLNESMQRVRGTYRTPEQRQQDLQKSMYDAARSNSSVQF